MLGRGIAHVIVSLGANGAVFATAEGVLHAAGTPPLIRSTVGAGDALLAGYMLGLVRGLAPAARARLATGFSLGALTMIGPHLPPAATVESLAASVSITPLTA
jgi:1-phosphofructokinase